MNLLAFSQTQQAKQHCGLLDLGHLMCSMGSALNERLIQVHVTRAVRINA